MLKWNAELLLGVAVCVLAILGLAIAIPMGIDLPSDVESRALSPDFWPNVIMTMLILCGAILIFQSQRSKPTPEGDAVDSEDANDEFERMRPIYQQVLRIGGVIVWLLGVYYVIPHVGMVAAASATLLLLAWLGNDRRWKVVLPVAILLPLLLYFFFTVIANVPLPIGVFEAFR